MSIIHEKLNFILQKRSKKEDLANKFPEIGIGGSNISIRARIQDKKIDKVTLQYNRNKKQITNDMLLDALETFGNFDGKDIIEITLKRGKTHQKDFFYLKSYPTNKEEMDRLSVPKPASKETYEKGKMNYVNDYELYGEESKKAIMAVCQELGIVYVEKPFQIHTHQEKRKIHPDTIMNMWRRLKKFSYNIKPRVKIISLGGSGIDIQPDNIELIKSVYDCDIIDKTNKYTIKNWLNKAEDWMELVAKYKIKKSNIGRTY